ncbi:MAG: hypothetical protein NTZ90_10555 [Proteobacteria bacterium]|nr:hypothetical protein [Pseudomonadota bacterium]
MSLFTDELHIHLYGCLSAMDVWTLGRDRYRKMSARLDWYASEYAAAYGRTPEYRLYWEQDHGFELLKNDFLFTNHGSFAQFQACFNLMIALFPAVPGDTTILEHVLKAQRAQGLRYGEYRCFTPPYLTSEQVTTFVGAAADAAARIDQDSGGQFKPRLAFSISRDVAHGQRQHLAIRAALKDQAERQRVVTGLDFCGVEAGHPPGPMAPLFSAILTANQEHPASALAILYHVGESFDDMSVMSAMRWVWQAHRLGAHRLGHATALGLDLAALAGTTHVRESVAERLDHLAWLEVQASWLAERGHRIDLQEIKAERTHLASLPADAVTQVNYDETAIAGAKSLQNSLLQDLAAAGAIVESCPTSNLRIGRIADPLHHPLIRFVASGLTTVVSSDDPGIFAIDLEHEERVCRSELKLSDAALQRLQATNQQVWSEGLSKRPGF